MVMPASTRRQRQDRTTAAQFKMRATWQLSTMSPVAAFHAMDMRLAVTHKCHIVTAIVATGEAALNK